MKEKILELRRRGLSYVEIQKQLGCSKSTIYPITVKNMD